jgi:hypothetical protein
MWNFASEITNSNIMEKLDKNSLSDPNTNYKIITEVLGKANNKHMPYKLVKFKKHKYSQWITNGILKSIKYRDNLHNQLRRLNPTSIEHVINTSNLKTYNSILKLEQPNYHTMNNCLTRIKMTQGKHGKPLTKYYIGQLKKVHYLNISKTEIIK